MKYLHAYISSGDTIGTDKQTWTDGELNGNVAFKTSINVSESGYENISNLVNWDRFYTNTTETVVNTRTEITTLVNTAGFENLTEQEKKIAAKWLVVDQTTRDSVLTDEEQSKYAKEISAAIASDPVEIILLENKLDGNETFSGGVNFDLVYNAQEGEFNSSNTNKMKLDTLIGDSSLYQISNNSVVIQEDGEYIISAEITLKGDQHTLGGYIWIDLNGFEVAGSKAMFLIGKDVGTTVSISSILSLSANDSVSLYNNRDSGINNKTYYQPSNGTRLLLRKK